MKKLLLINAFCLISIISYNQTNTFPSSGNVGINTLSPSAYLHIRGGSGSRGLYLQSTDNPGGGNAPMVLWDARNGGSDYVFFARQSGNSLQFNRYTGFWTGGLKILTLKGENGNVGIGTTTPTSKLEVNGTIRSKEVKVEASPWPDYVFTDAYELPGLQELDAYIQQHGHLPKIPTDKEVGENGISLGEMNAKLLEKIEELTIYTIEQEKKIEVQNERIEILEDNIKKLLDK